MQKKVRAFFCIYLLVCRVIFLMFFGSEESFLCFKLLCRPYTCLGEEIVFSAL